MKSITLKELAKHLSLGTTTISQTLNGRGNTRVSPQTRERILRAAQEFNYRPSLLSQALRTSSTKLIGLISATMSAAETYIARLSALDQALQEQGYQCLFSQHGHSTAGESAAIEMLTAREVDGLVYTSNWSSVSLSLRQLARRKFPIVAIGRVAGLDLPTVECDVQRGGEMIVEYLHAIGCRKIVFTQVDVDLSPNTTLKQREIGHRRAYERLYGPWRRATVIREPWAENDMALGARLGQRVLELNRPFDAVVCSNDLSAIGLIDTLRGANVPLGPGGVTIAGFDNLSIGQYLWPRIVTVDQCAAETGRIAASMVLELIQHKTLVSHPRHVVLQPKLIPLPDRPVTPPAFATPLNHTARAPRGSRRGETTP